MGYLTSLLHKTSLGVVFFGAWEKYPPKVGALMMGIYHDRTLKKSPTKQTKKEGILNFGYQQKDTKKCFRFLGPNLAVFFAVKPCKAPSASPRARSERAEADLWLGMKGGSLVFQSYERRTAKKNVSLRLAFNWGPNKYLLTFWCLEAYM